jgi:Acetyltransferase (GNAT) family
MPDRVRLTVPSETRSLPLVDAVCERFCDGLQVPHAEGRELASLVHDVVTFTLERAYPDDPSGQIEVTLDLVERAVQVDVHDWGRPVTSGGGELGALPDGLEQIRTRADNVRLINLGADGKRITFQKTLSAAVDTGPDAHDFESPPPTTAGDDIRQRVELRNADPGDAEAISQLLYANYHLSYGHPDFYRPRWVAEELEAGRLLSSLAVLDDEIIGHHATMLEEGATSAETGVAVIHPAFRGLGIFTSLANYSLHRSMELGLEALWGRAVTVHPYSQRAAIARGYRETALMLGSVPARMTMEGIEGAEAGKRTASLLNYRPLRPSPRPVELPSQYADLLRAALANADLLVADPPEVLYDERPVAVYEESSRATAVIRISAWDEREVTHSLRHVLAAHVDVVYADLDLCSGAATDAAIEHLNGEGFFYAGLVLFSRDGRDFLRLQLLNAEYIELEQTVCDSDVAQDMLRAVLEDRRRVDG